MTVSMSRIPGAVALLVLAAPAAAEPIGPYRTEMHPMTVVPGSVPRVVNSHILFLNPCKPAGCAVKVGTTDSRTDTSDIPNQNGTLSAFAGTQAQWDAMKTCVTNALKPFNITVTDVDPGTADHF